MTHFVVYYHPSLYERGELTRTLNGLVDSVAVSDITGITVCCDGDLHSDDEIEQSETNNLKINTILGDAIGRAKLWNLALESVDSEQVVFLNGPVKFKPGWFHLLKPYINELDLISSEICGLDRLHWSFDKVSWNKFGFRWDLDLICKRENINEPTGETAVLSAYCIAGKVSRFKAIGGFDGGMKIGQGEDLEISIRNWMMGGKCLVVLGSKIAITPRIANDNDVANKARIAELWFGKRKQHFYDSLDIKPGDVKAGRLNNLSHLANKFTRTFNWYIEDHQPEIGRLYDLPKWSGKSVGIVSNGHSIDVIDSATINRHDILIGVDFMGSLFECDYVVTNDVAVVEVISDYYKQKEIMLPVKVTDVNNGRYVHYKDFLPQANVFETSSNIMTDSKNANPPFIDYNDNTMYAAQIAMFMKPREIIIYGLDNKIIDGKSHTSKIEYYNGGSVLADNAVTRKHFANVEYGLSRLGIIASKKGISLLRMSHL